MVSIARAFAIYQIQSEMDEFCLKWMFVSSVCVMKVPVCAYRYAPEQLTSSNIHKIHSFSIEFVSTFFFLEKKKV